MIIDLTHIIDAHLSVYPGLAAPQITELGPFENQPIFLKEYTFNGHIGTHVDVPAHLFAKGASAASLDISTFWGTAQVIDCTNIHPGATIDASILQQLNSKKFPDFILFFTGWSKHWGTPEYFEPFPVPSKNLIKELAGAEIKGIGVDAISIDPVDTTDYPNHKMILGAGKIIIENLTNLKCLFKQFFQFSCLPLKLANGDGSPVRAIGITNGYHGDSQ